MLIFSLFLFSNGDIIDFKIYILKEVRYTFDYNLYML